MTIKLLVAEDYNYILPDHWIPKDESYWSRLHDSYVTYVVEKLKEFNPIHVVEVGCGDGWNCGKVVEKGMNITGFDWSKNGIEHAKRMVPQGSFVCGDIRDPDILNEYRSKFDCAIFVEVIEHIPPDDCVLALKNIKNLLCKDGKLILTTPSANLKNTNPQHYRHFAPSLLREIIQESGFCVLELTGYGDVRKRNAYYRLSRYINNRFF